MNCSAEVRYLEKIKDEHSMEIGGEDKPPQLLSLGRKDAERLLEVYVKRSLSLNDAPAGIRRPAGKPRKWIPRAERTGPARRHSSESCAGLPPDEAAAVIADFRSTQGPAERPLGTSAEISTNHPENDPIESTAEQKKDDSLPKKSSKKSKKPSFWKSFLGLFSRDKKEGRKSSSPERAGSLAVPGSPPSPSISCLPVPGPSAARDQGRSSPQARRSIRRRLSRRFSLRNRSSDQPRSSLKKPETVALSETKHVQNRFSVEPTNLYYEKVSEELEKIVQEAKDSPSDECRSIFHQSPETLRSRNAKEAEVIERIIDLIKQQGDAIDKELKQTGGVGGSSGVGPLFHALSYGSFRQLADLYVESGAPAGAATEGGATAPELVKFAFSLDFTAKVAGLSSQTLGRVMGFGNQYLQDRFTQMSAAHGATESQSRPGQNFSGPD